MEQRNLLSPREKRQLTLTRHELARRLERGFRREGRSDAANAARLGGYKLDGPLPTRLTPAAVLVPLVEREEGLSVLLTQRTAHLSHHPGQISFPGGRLEECDQGDAVVCALRETEEEIGLPPARVDVVGRLDDYVTGTGFRVFPVVGLIRPPFELNPDPFEVAEVFEVPLCFILDPANHQLHSRVVEGRDRAFYAMPYENRFIWGATAGMLVNLYEVLGVGTVED